MDTTGVIEVPAKVPEVPGKVPAKGARRRRPSTVGNPHRGVVLLPPRPPRNPRWQARYVDPDTHKRVKQTLTDAEARTAATRREAAIRIFDRITLRRLEIEAGKTTRHTDSGMSIDAAIDLYFDKWGDTLADNTRNTYRDACDLFKAWAKTNALRTVRDITKGKLNEYSATRAAAPKLGGSANQRGKRTRVVVGKRSNATVNRELCSLRNVLSQLRRMEIVRISRDDLADGIQTLDADDELGEFQRTEALRAIIAACLEHDAAVFRFTREGRVDKKRARYAPALPLVLFFLLTGMRTKEGRALDWSQVDNDEGVIVLQKTITKTKRRRVVDMKVSPLLAALMSAGGSGNVLAGWTKPRMASTRRRLIDKFGAPDFTFQGLRRTCGTFITCAPGIYGAESPHQASQRLGHSIKVAERHYWGVVTVPREARTIEAAMGIVGVPLALTPDTCPRLSPAPTRRAKRATRRDRDQS